MAVGLRDVLLLRCSAEPLTADASKRRAVLLQPGATQLSSKAARMFMIDVHNPCHLNRAVFRRTPLYFKKRERDDVWDSRITERFGLTDEESLGRTQAETTSVSFLKVKRRTGRVGLVVSGDVAPCPGWRRSSEMQVDYSRCTLPELFFALRLAEAHFRGKPAQ